MQAKIDEFTAFISMKNTSATVKSYRYHLLRLAASAPARLPEEWTTAQLIGYLAALRSGGNGEALIKQIVCSFRSFFSYTCGENSPAKGVPFPKIHRRKQRTLDSETALKVLASCDSSTHTGTRDLALLSLMLDSGLRASEVCRLKLSKIDFGKRRFQVIVKGGDEEIGVYGKTTAVHLARWLSIRPDHALPDVDTLFVSLGGTTPGASLTRHGLKIVFNYIAKRAGLEHFSPHDLRRTFATIAIRSGAPTRVVQAAGRWGDISMVEHYTAEISAEDFERYSPVEALMKGRE